MNWLDPSGLSLLQAHVLYTQLDAERIEGDGSTSQCARCARPHRFPSQRHLDVVQPLLTDDLVFEHPSRTCSADANPYLVAGATGRASRSRVSRPAHSHPSVAPVALPYTTCTATTSTAACLRWPSAPARHPNAMRPVTAKPLPPAPRAYDHTTCGTSTADALLRPCPQGFATPRPRAPQIRHAAGAALPPHARCPTWDVRHHRRAQRPMCPIFPYRIHRFPRLPPTTTISGAAPFSRGPNYHPASPPACAALAVAVLHRRRRALLLPAQSTPTYPTPCLRTLGPDTQRHRHAPASKLTRSYRRAPAEGLSYPHVCRAAPPTAFLPPHQAPPRWGVACAIRLAPAVAGDRLQHHHTARNIPRDYEPAARCARCTARLRRPYARYSVRDAVPRRHAGRHASAHASPDPHRQPHGQRMTLAFLVPALRDRLDQCTTLTARPPRLPRSSGPPATPPASAARATVVLHRWRRLRRLFIRHHHLLSSPLDARGWAHPQHNTDIPSTCGSLSPPRTPRSSPPPAPSPSSAPSHPRSKPAPGTHHEHDAHALHAAYPCAVTVFSAAPPSAQSRVLSRSASMTRTTTSVHSTRYSYSPSPTPLSSHPHAPTICSSPAPPACAADIRIRPPRRSFPPSHRPTPALPVYSTKASATPARGAACADGVDPQRYDAPAKSAQAHGDDAQPPLGQQLRCGQELRSRCAPSSSARQLRPPFGNADPPQALAGERGKGYLLRECCRSAGSDAAYISFSPFFVYHSFMYFM
ncbi:hypothetical protein B0H13DRAFT_2492851 [Mycena leptocephala]|nr:hypothetical protein B0H13DRAFT_2492851 [Mycena leptocephala]